MSSEHDSGYKLLFSHPEMVRDLLCDWVPGEWIQEADFSTLTQVNGSYVAENMKQRHDDMVWRVMLKDRWLWVYLVMEFQSEPDEWMALRMLVYVGLLAQNLVSQGELAEGKLPPILPLVLYNGEPRWKEAVEVGELFAPAPRGLDAYRPRLRYHLIDEGRLKLDPAESVRNAVDALFRLERGRTPEDLIRIGEALRDLLRDPSQTRLRRNFTVWINSLLHRKTGGHTIEDIEPINDILEPNTMLAERIQSWFDEATRKGIQQGRTEGLDEGIVKGRMEGETKLLARQLERRFGPLPKTVAERLAGASEAQLEAWGEAVLSAPTLDAVFADSRH